MPAYLALPTPPPTPATDNPVSYPATATAAVDRQGATIAAYNTEVARVNAQLTTIRAQVSKDAKQLSSWNPLIDNRATSLWGCLQLARQRLAAPAATRYLIIASDLKYTTGVDYHRRLPGVPGAAGRPRSCHLSVLPERQHLPEPGRVVGAGLHHLRRGLGPLR